MNKAISVLGVLAIMVGLIGISVNLVDKNYVWVFYDVGLLFQGILLLIFFK